MQPTPYNPNAVNQTVCVWCLSYETKEAKIILYKSNWQLCNHKQTCLCVFCHSTTSYCTIIQKWLVTYVNTIIAHVKNTCLATDAVILRDEQKHCIVHSENVGQYTL